MVVVVVDVLVVVEATVVLLSANLRKNSVKTFKANKNQHQK